MLATLLRAAETIIWSSSGRATPQHVLGHDTARSYKAAHHRLRPDFSRCFTWFRECTNQGCAFAAQPEAVDAALSLFYSTAAGTVGGGGSSGGQTFSRSAERKTLMMHYALALALHVESFAMAPEQVRCWLTFAPQRAEPRTGSHLAPAVNATNFTPKTRSTCRALPVLRANGRSQSMANQAT